MTIFADFYFFLVPIDVRLSLVSKDPGAHAVICQAKYKQNLRNTYNSSHTHCTDFHSRFTECSYRSLGLVHNVREDSHQLQLCYLKIPRMEANIKRTFCFHSVKIFTP